MFEKVDDLTCGQFRLSCRGCGDVSREILASPQQLEPASNGWGKYVSLHTALAAPLPGSKDPISPSLRRVNAPARVEISTASSAPPPSRRSGRRGCRRRICSFLLPRRRHVGAVLARLPIASTGLRDGLISRALPHAHVPALSGHSQLGLVRRVRGDDVSALNEEIGIALELRHAVHLRDERPGGGAHDEQPDRRDQPGPGGTGRRSRSRSTRSPPPRTWPNFSACRTSWLGPRTASGILGMAERVVNVGSVLQLIVHPASS
jgi:hypothetical protein